MWKVWSSSQTKQTTWYDIVLSLSMLASFSITMTNMFSPREMEGKDIVGAGMHFSDVENSSSGNEIFCVEMHWNIFPPSQISIYQQEDEEAPIYRSPNIWSWSFWKEWSSDKTGFCVAHDGQTNWLENLWLPCFMFEQKIKQAKCHKPSLLWLFQIL